MRKTLAALFVCLIGLTGCSSLFKKEVAVHVIEGRDYHEEKDAAGKVNFVCLTPVAFQEIAKARLDR
jgi:hypothetical protein